MATPLKPPSALAAERQAFWTRCLKHLQEQGTFDYPQRALLDEFVLALNAASDAREDGRDTDWDRHTKRASALADQLALTPRGRKAAGLRDGNDDEAPADPFADFDGLKLAG